MMGTATLRKVHWGSLTLALAFLATPGYARDLNDDAPFGPGGADYRLPDPTPMFLLQAPIKTDLVKENPLNAVPASAEILAYSGNLTQLHDNFGKTMLGKLAEQKMVADYLSNLASAFEDDFARGNGSFSDVQVAERRLEWKMYQDFYASADHEFAVFMYWTRGREEPNFVLIAAAQTGTELNESANVLRDYFSKRREKNSHLSVVDRTHKTKRSSNAIKQINSDQSLTIQEAYCIRNNLAIYAKGPGTIDDVLDRLESPENSIIGKPDNRYKQMYVQTSVSPQEPPDLLVTVLLNQEFVRRLPESLQANLQNLVGAMPNQEINAAAGVRFDAQTGRIQERVFLATGDVSETTTPENPDQKGNAFRTARLLDPSRTVLYISTFGELSDWSTAFAREQLMGSGLPRFLTGDSANSAKEALGGELAIAYYSRDRQPEMSDYLRQVVIMEVKNHAKLDAWLVNVKASCGEGFARGEGQRIPVGDNTIIAQTILGNDKANENLGRAGFEALVEKLAQGGTVSAEQARAPLNFFPAYSVVVLTDENNQQHEYVLGAYSVATLRQVLASVKQASNLAASVDFRERTKISTNVHGVTVYLNTPTTLNFLKDDLFNMTSADAEMVSLGNMPVKNAFLSFAGIYDNLLRDAEPSAFVAYRTRGGLKIEGSSVFGHLAPLGLLQAYSQLTLREREYNRHAAVVRSKLQAIKVALDLYRISSGRFPARDALPDLKQYLKTDEYQTDEHQFSQIQTAEFLRIFSFLGNDAVLADVEQAKQPAASNLVYVDGVDDRSIGDAVIVYEAKPSGKKGTFFCLHRDGRIDTLTAAELAADLPEPDKIKNPYSPGLVRALETAAGK